MRSPDSGLARKDWAKGFHLETSMSWFSSFRLIQSSFVRALVILAVAAPVSFGQPRPQPQKAESFANLPLYQSLKEFHLAGEAPANNVVLERDRVKMTFQGTFYFESPIEGRVRGAVFIGKGRVHADPPGDAFEKGYVQRMLHAPALDSTFKTAVLRFSDDTMEALGVTQTPTSRPPGRARHLATKFSPHLLHDTGANVLARIVVSILNQESPGFFCAEFDGGSRGRFGLILDYQARLPEAHFGLDTGEKGLFFAYDQILYRPDVWMAFYSRKDYQRGTSENPNVFALARISNYDMDIDLRHGLRTIKLKAHMRVTALADGVRAIPLVINEDLDADYNFRRDRGMHLTGAYLADGERIVAIQEPWDGGVTLVLPKPVAKGQVFEPILDFKGEYLLHSNMYALTNFPRRDTWYPRTVPLYPTTFDLTFHHSKGTLVASIGSRIVQKRTRDGKMLTEWRMDMPVRLATFVEGYYTVKTQEAQLINGKEVGLENYSLLLEPNNDFTLNEMANCVRFFSFLYGPYPYSRLGALNFWYFPGRRSLPTIVILPPEFSDSRDIIFHNGRDISSQWWSSFITWRSYRDQWLFEGLAQYSALLYTKVRLTLGDERFMITLMYQDLVASPGTLAGLGPGHTVDVGPIIMGRRLSTRETYGVWDALVRDKGALVIRMLHFLFSNPATGDDSAFFVMLQDFFSRYCNHVASTEDFIAVANAHFADTPIAKEYKLKDLDWFFQQWVYSTPFPSYGLSYSITRRPNGSAIVHGTIVQKNTPNQWMMPIPVLARFGHGKTVTRIVLASGPETQVNLAFPYTPRTIRLDPQQWVISQKTTTTKMPRKIGSQSK